MKKNRLLFGFIAVILAFNLNGCKDPYFSGLDMSQINNVSTSLKAPGAVYATHGNNGEITLSWTGAESDKQYLIYAAENPFSDFVLEAETSGKNKSYTLSYPAGTTRWFRVCAVGIDKKVSPMSDYFCGSTISEPIIYSINLGEDGTKTKAQVSWYMQNCTTATYINDVTYRIECYAKDKITIVDELHAAGAEDSVVFTGLDNKQIYYYRVFAKVGDNQEIVSAYADAETSRKTTPLPPEDLLSTRGVTSEYTYIKWNIPDEVGFGPLLEPHPVYFTIERKNAELSDAAFVPIVNYIGVCRSPENESEKNNIIRINCKDKTSSLTPAAEAPFNSYLTVESTEGAEGIPVYEEYIPGTILTYYDYTATEGIQYTYRVQSYTDDAGNKKITGPTSAATINAWLISNPSIEAQIDFNKQENRTSEIKDGTITFNFNFKDFGMDAEGFYKYVLTSQRTRFELDATPEAEVIIQCFESADALRAYKIEMNTDQLNANEGYYNYSVYIMPAAYQGEELPSEEDAFASCKTNTPICVTSDASKLPEITYFNVKDGYASKYILEWDYNPAYTYSLLWTKYVNGSPAKEKSSLELKDSDLTFETRDEKQYATYTHTEGVVSGDSRKYTLIAKIDLSSTKEAPEVSQTLGTASPSIKAIYYDKLVLSWPEVQNANHDPSDFEIKAYYADDPLEKNLVITEGEDANLSLEFSQEEKLYICTIEKPEGYNKAKKAGKPICFTVTAKNAETADTTTNDPVFTRVMGPAAINARAGGIEEFAINILWDEVPGAKGYLIKRNAYTPQGTLTCPIYYDVSEKKTYRYGSSVGKERLNVSYVNGTYSLVDRYTEKKDDMDTDQEMISMGYPYTYTILPVLNGQDDFTFDEGITSSETEDIMYIDIEDETSTAFVNTYTMGYGLNVTASKCESQDSITVSWTKPNDYTDCTPYIYRRLYGTSTWEYIGSVTSDKTEFNDLLKDQDQTRAYYYAVKYKRNKGSIELSESYEKSLKTMDTRYADGIEDEELNKGYLFYIDLNAEYNGTMGANGKYIKDSNYYSQKLNHSLWDFQERKRGPQSFDISIWNLNLARGPLTFAHVDIDKTTGKETISIDADNRTFNGQSYTVLKDGSSDTIIQRQGSAFIFSPLGISEGNTTDTAGMLRVLRSTRTYYGINSTFTYSLNGKPAKTVNMETSTFGYRQITDDELYRSVGLIIADSLYKAGIPKYYSSDVFARPKYWADNECAGSSGKFTIGHQSWSDHSRWGFTTDGYVHLFSNGGSSYHTNQFSSEFTIKAGQSSGSKAGASEHTLFYMEPMALTIVHESGLETMNCTLTFEAGAEGTIQRETVTFTKEKQPAVTKSGSDMYMYFPYDLGNKHKNGDSTINSKLETYKNDKYNWWN